MNRTFQNIFGCAGYGLAAVWLTLSNTGPMAAAGVVIFLLTAGFHLVFNRCPNCGKFLGFTSFSHRCKRCRKEFR